MVTLPRNGFVQPVEGIPGGVPIPVVPGSNPTSFVTFQKLVTAPGTAEQFPSHVISDGLKFVIKAKDGNTGKIYIGASQADAQDPTVAFELNPSQGVFCGISNTSGVWIDADNAGEGVDVMTVAEYSGGGGGGGGSAAANRPAFATGQLDVASPGTAEQLPTQAIPNGFTVFLRAKPTNNGNIYIGNSQANAQDPTVAMILEPGAFLEYGITNEDLIWVDSDDAADGVMFTSEV